MKRKFVNTSRNQHDSINSNCYDELCDADYKTFFPTAKGTSYAQQSKYVLLLLIAVLMIGTVHAQRDPYLWPFAVESIWNMPIHNNAVYVDAGISAPTQWGVTEDEEPMVLDNANAPTVNVYRNGWDSSQRCVNVGGFLTALKIPDGWSNPASSHNACGTVLDIDGVTFRQFQSLHRCATTGDAYALVEYPSEIMTGGGIQGSHGGSGMSAIGGTIRVGELTPDGDIFNNPDIFMRHAIKINIYANKYMAYKNDGTPGYRWPAVKADSYAATNYKGTVPALEIGALLALPPSIDVENMGLQTAPGKIIARTLQKFGAYVVDDTAWDVVGFTLETSSAGRVMDDFQTKYGYPFNPSSTSHVWAQDVAIIVANLYVVDNNSATTIGGGSTSDHTNRLYSVACPIGTAGSGIKTCSAAPSVPSGLSVTATSSSQIDLTWTDNSSNEVGFKIERKTESGGTYAEIAMVGAGVTTYSNTGLTASTNYYYRVRSYNTAGNSSYTSEATATTQAEGISIPTFVAAGSVAAGTGTINPALPSGIATNDILLLFLETANQTISVSNQNGGTWTQVANSPQGTGTAGGTSATRLTVFWSRYNGTQGAPTASDAGNHQVGSIIAIRGAVTSGDPFDVTAGGVESTADVSGSIPGATTTVAATLLVGAIATALPDANGTSNFSSWANSNLTSVTERTANTSSAGNGGGLAIVTGIKATAGAYSYTAVTCGSSSVKGMMSIAIKPQNSSITIPNAPSGISATTVSSSQIDLAWTDNSSNEDGFRIERKTGSGGTYVQIATIGAGVTTYSNTGLTASTTYYYRVRTYNSAGNSSYSNEASATTQSTGGSILYTEDFNDNIAQDWSVLSGTWNATGYEFYNSSSGVSERCFYNGSTFADFTFTVKAKPVWDNWYGIIYNYQDANNYYYVWVKASTNIELRKVQGGTTTTLFSGTYSGGGANVYSTIEIINNGTNTSVKVNGSTVFNNISTPQWAYGKIGLWSDYCPVYFDDVQVTALSTLKSAMVTTGIIDQKISQLHIYPNPASTSEITIEADGDHAVKSLKIINISGKVVLEQELDNSNKHTVDISKISKGLYLVHLLVDDKAFSKKLLIE